MGIIAFLFLNLNASSIILRKSSSSQQQELRSQQEWQPQQSLHKKSSLRNVNKRAPTTATTATHKSSSRQMTCLTETQCNNQRQILNIPPSKYYVGTYPEVYGCYAKNDKLFWSSGGGVSEMAIHPLKGVKERVWCDYDDDNKEGEQLIAGVDKYTQKRDAPSIDDTEDVRVKLHRNNGENQDDEDNGNDIKSKNDIYRMVQETKEGKVNRGKIAWLMRYVFRCMRETLHA